MFLHVSDSVHRCGGYLGRYTHPHPLQVPPTPRAGTAPRQVHSPLQVPPRQVHPPGQVQPPRACRDTVNKRAVRILLECILVHSWFLLGYNSNNIVYQNTVERFVKRGISSKIDGYSCYFSRHLIATSKSRYV